MKEFKQYLSKVAVWASQKSNKDQLKHIADACWQREMRIQTSSV